MRNVLIAAGNSGDGSLAEIVAEKLSHASPLVRAMAVWALARLAPSRLAALAQVFRAGEEDADVLREWAAAEALFGEAGRNENADEQHARDCAVKREEGRSS
jgi:epoxyqueuosine reductase